MKRDGDFMSKPDEGWTHNTAALSVGNGVYYSFPVRYIGSIQVRHFPSVPACTR